ncbi:hypothetical protein [Flammeovirga pacifica]|uniref:DUF4843 domain-containing protein n=1 Tax=Flammeovirga pacifica TaxID=915059 RepID=A0A1S1YTE1_FLAPC|nr:hypothetical protein [Flammeovirga pacifica]OHX64301.1 hypothetical protein NH26_22150 [Flammeovirga pacifica]
MKLLARLATLMLLSVCLFSCNDDDDADPRDVNAIYFETDSISFGDVGFNNTNLQVQFNTASNSIEVVVRGTLDLPSGTRAETTVSVVVEHTQTTTSYTRNGDNYTIQIDSASSYDRALKEDATCTVINLGDAGFTNGRTGADVTFEDILVWDNSQQKYYMPSEKVGELIGLIIDPGFGNDDGAGGNVVYPKIWSSSGTIKKCGEFPTLLPN